MKTKSTVALAASILAPFAVAQMDEDGIYHIGNIAISQDAISCLVSTQILHFPISRTWSLTVLSDRMRFAWRHQ